MEYESRIDRCYRWLEKKDKLGEKTNLKRFVTWSGTWIGILGPWTISYLMKDNFELNQYNELKAAAIGILPYSLGMGISYLGAKAVCAVGRKREAQQQPVAEPKGEDISDSVL